MDNEWPDERFVVRDKWTTKGRKKREIRSRKEQARKKSRNSRRKIKSKSPGRK